MYTIIPKSTSFPYSSLHVKGMNIVLINLPKFHIISHHSVIITQLFKNFLIFLIWNIIKPLKQLISKSKKTLLPRNRNERLSHRQVTVISKSCKTFHVLVGVETRLQTVPTLKSIVAFYTTEDFLPCLLIGLI